MSFLHRGGSLTGYLSIRPGEGALLPFVTLPLWLLGIVLDEEPAELSFLGLPLFLRGITGLASLSMHGRSADE
ncbi:hypothetical protein TNCV_686311 [Trichonephila clavipes]|nr:hypothetical protein TNCV_686311 [Trichonephila clavipes]